MFCETCGQKLVDGAKFCGACGSKQSEGLQTPHPTTAPIIEPVVAPYQEPVKVSVQPTQQPVQPIQQPVQPIQQPVQPIPQPVPPVQQPVQPVRPVVQPTQQPVQRPIQPQGQPQYQQQPNQQYAASGVQGAAVLSVGDYLKMFFLLSIPLVNIIFMLLWAFNSSENPNKRNYALASLLFFVIMMVVGFVLSILLGGLFMAMFSQMGGSY